MQLIIAANVDISQDNATYDAISSEESIQTLRQPAEERAAYIAVEYSLALNNLRIPRERYTERDADVQLSSSFNEYKHGEEALLWRAAHFRYDIASRAQHELEDYEKPTGNVCDAILEV